MRDGALGRADTEEMAEAIESKRAWQYFEERYRGFLLTDADFVQNNVNRGLYIRFEMRRALNAECKVQN